MSELDTQTWSFGSGTKLSSLSNRWPCRVLFPTREYVSGEHAFHGEKYTQLGQLCADPDRAKQLLDYAAQFVGDTLTIDDAHRAGSHPAFPLTPEERAMWSELSLDVQSDICRWKAEHCREVQQDLFLSGFKTLVHLNTRGGKRAHGFWHGEARVHPVSGNVHVIGRNMLGYIWMDIRADRLAAIEWADERYAY